MKQRTITAIFFVAIMLAGVFGHLYSFLLLFGLITVVSAWELMSLLFGPEADHLLLRKVTGSALAALFYGIFSYSTLNRMQTGVGLPAMDPMLVITCLALPFLVLLGLELVLASRQPFPSIGNYLLAVVYVALPFALLVSLATDGGQYMPLRVLGLMLLNWSNDTMAYLIGSQIGKRPFFSRISPKKTWEGTLGGIVGVFVVSWLLSMIIPDFSRSEWLALGAVAAVMGTAGDLVESMLKRSVHIKDSGNIMPGHGGFLDRFDSLIYFLPFAWVVIRLF
jgi:phosphatidate cytidylyltransferase